MAPPNSKFGRRVLLLGILILTILVLVILKMLSRRRSKISLLTPEKQTKYQAKDFPNSLLTGMGKANIVIPEPLPHLLYSPEITAWKNLLFPYQIKDLMLGDPQYFGHSEYYSRLTELVAAYPQPVSAEDFRSVLQYKTFLESKPVYSTASHQEFDQLYVLLLKVFGKRVPGDLVECGVWRGGMLMFWKAATDHYRKMGLDVVAERKVWGFDAFGKFPPPEDHPLDKAIHPLNAFLYENPPARNEVAGYFQHFGLLDETVELRAGDFAVSLAEATELSEEARLRKIALLRVDCDYYAATLLCLEYLYPLVSKGGFVIVENYHHPAFGCRQAVDDFRKLHGISSPFVASSGSSVSWEV